MSIYVPETTPEGYYCRACKKSGCKLWRIYGDADADKTLRCAPCAARPKNIDVSKINTLGELPDKHGGWTDQIGWYIPAVPTRNNRAYWGYTSVPEEAVKWWRSLKSLP